MHPNQVYHRADAQRNLDFARERAFGVLAVSGEEGPVISACAVCFVRGRQNT